MKVSIHQPNYLPYLGFFSKIKQSDLFILFDNAQYVKNDFHNRNRIKTAQGAVYLTIPIPSKECYKKKICEVKLPKDSRWAEKHWKSIELNYKKADFFSEYSDFFEKIYFQTPEMLVDLNESIITYMLKQFSIRTKIVRASELKAEEFKGTEALIEMLRKVNATTYISGKGREGKGHYIDEKRFEEAGIKLEFQNFAHPEYRQQYQNLGFIENLSAIDLLFNLGEKSEGLI